MIADVPFHKKHYCKPSDMADFIRDQAAPMFEVEVELTQDVNAYIGYVRKAAKRRGVYFEIVNTSTDKAQRFIVHGVLK